MGVILAILLAFLYATVCLIMCGCTYQPPSRLMHVIYNVLMLFLGAVLCWICFTVTAPDTIGGFIAFGVYCLITSSSWLSQVLATKEYIIDKNKVYDFKPKWAFNNEDGTKTYVGYIDNGVAQTPVIVNNCKDDLHKVSIKVQYFGNCREQPFRVKLYNKERQKHLLVDFRIEVQKVEV